MHSGSKLKVLLVINSSGPSSRRSEGQRSWWDSHLCCFLALLTGRLIEGSSGCVFTGCFGLVDPLPLFFSIIIIILRVRGGEIALAVWTQVRSCMIIIRRQQKHVSRWNGHLWESRMTRHGILGLPSTKDLLFD